MFVLGAMRGRSHRKQDGNQKRAHAPMLAACPGARQACRSEKRMLRPGAMARAEKDVAEPALAPSAARRGDRLPAFVREISWLRWLEPLPPERRLVIGLTVLAA